MAKNDYFVLAYRILIYLYACLKDGGTPDISVISAEELKINDIYWEYVMRHLYTDGFIEGVTLVPMIGRKTPAIKISESIMITPEGIDFLQSNSAMSKAKEFLKTLKEIIPGM